MVNLFLRIYDFLHARRALRYGIMAAVVILLGTMVSTLKYNENIYDFLPMDTEQQKAVNIYQDITGSQRIVAMIRMKDDNVENTERISEAIDAFTNELRSHEGVKHIKDVVSQVDYEKIAGIADFAYRNIPYMLNDSDYTKMERIIKDQECVKGKLEQDVQQIMMPATGVFATNIGYDPLGLFSPLMERLQSRQASLPLEMDNGYMFTADHKYGIVMMTSRYGSMESANNTLLVNYVDSVSRLTMASMPDINIAITGSPVIAVDNASQIKKDSALAILISVVLILALLICSFRSFKNLVLIGCSILFGWLFAMAFIAMLRDNVSLIVLGIGSIIIGIAVNYPLHFVAHISHGANIREVLKDMVSPLLIGNITTVGAFACLIPLDAPALRDLGLFAAFMLIGTILFVLIFLPHLASPNKTPGQERLLFGKISTFSPKIPRWAFIAIVVLTGVLGYFSLGTSFDANMHNINYLTPTQEKLMADLHISAGIKDTANIYIVAEGDNWEEALQERKDMTPLLEELKAKGKVSSYSDVSSFICSKHVQAEKLKRWHDFWGKYRQETLRLLAVHGSEYGFSSDAFDNFTQIISAEYQPMPFEHFEPLIAALFNHSFSESNGRCNVVDIVVAQDGSVSEVEDIINNAKKATFSFDFVGMNSSVANALSDNFNYIGFACGFIVFAFLWLSFGRIELALLAFLPMAIGWLWILGIMNILDMRFNIVNIILATFIFGQGDDYTIFMTDGLINEYAYRKKVLPSYKNSILISALIMFIGMGSLIVAKHPALHSLAEVTIVGMISVVLMAWIVPPMIFNWLIKTEGKVRHSPVTLGKVICTIICSIVYLGEILIGCLIGVLIRALPWKRKLAQQWLHRRVYQIMSWNLRNIWGIKHYIHNPWNEQFQRGGIIVCNHQSILDPLLILALSPHVLILISDKVWQNPFVHTLFKLIGFIRLEQPMDKLQDEISEAVSYGYNVVIFPEGKRNEERITRFHRGAFHIAQEISADILPIYIHGVNHIMPRGSGFASKGRIDIYIGERQTCSELKNYGSNSQKIARSFLQNYKTIFEKMRSQIEDTHYFHDYVMEKYIYKGRGVEMETKMLLKHHNDFSQWIDDYSPTTGAERELSIVHAGRGQFSLLFALVHPDIQVHSFADDSDDLALAKACWPSPQNLHIHDANVDKVKSRDIIDFSVIIKR